MIWIAFLSSTLILIIMGHKHTEETKKRMSESKKKWLKENPDKHVWKRHSKFKSVPCETLKSYIKSKNINYLEEFSPVMDRGYSVDVAFPEKMVCLEVNGNQHYDATGKLKPYYQEKHDLISKLGWKIIEMHYSLCFKEDYISSLLSTISSLPIVNDFDYEIWKNGGPTGIRAQNVALEERSDIQFHHRPLDKFQYEIYIREVKKNVCVDCGKEISLYNATRCIDCRGKMSRKPLPDKEELQKLVLATPLWKLGPQFGMTDNGLKKRCKKMGINLPGNSYRLKQFFGNKLVGSEGFEPPVKAL